MIQKNYNDMILTRIEVSFDKLIPISGIVALLSSIIIYFSQLSIKFAFIDGSFGIIFLLMAIFREKINIENKIMMTIMAPITIGFLSFLDGGFSSSLITLLSISNVVAVLFLSKKKSYSVAFISIIGLMTLCCWSSCNHINPLISIGIAKWFIQILTFVLYLLILHNIIYAVRKYLFENIKELEKSIENIFKLAYFDNLTDLPNQFMFKKQLYKKIENRDVNGVLVFFSIKNLNLINSVYGESIGDIVLVETAKIFLSLKGKNDILARISGNEYAFWLDQFENINERISYIENEFQTRFHLENMTQKIEFYIGFTYYNCSNDSIIDSYQKAGMALTFAKIHQKNEIIAYDHTLDEIIRYEETVKEKLVEALKADEFKLVYQSKVNAISGEVMGVEALARWNNNFLGEVPPFIFIPLLEKINLSVSFGEFVVKRAFSQYKGLCKKYHNKVKLSINISPSQLISRGFIEFIEAEINEYQINPENIILEITESIIIEGIEQVSELIESLKKIGVKISIDDFGSGYSSLNYLTKMDIDELKIDKSFVDQIGKNEKINIMLNLIVQLANAYKLDVVAEGVETKAQLDMIIGIGCNVIQGYYYSKPEEL